MIGKENRRTYFSRELWAGSVRSGSLGTEELVGNPRLGDVENDAVPGLAVIEDEIGSGP